MPLPDNGTAWPPKHLDNIHGAIGAWDAWWVGDVGNLEAAYAARTGVNATRPSQLAGGVVGTVARFFWGRPQQESGTTRTKLHVPIATDICQASADLVWSEAPAIKVDDETTQKRLDQLVDDQALQTFVEGHEAGAAHGGHFLRVAWDPQVKADGPFLAPVHADAADAEFRWGRLSAVTFWHVVREDGQQRWRHLERHEVDSQGHGVILHGLYLGTADNLGTAVPLTDIPATAPLALQVDTDGAISTQSPGLAVTYVPNQRPQRRWRKDPAGKDLGRSDLDGVEGMMDALDEVWSSWMRDIRLGKARIMAPESMLESNAPGHGAGFDLDREVFVPLNMLPGREAPGLPVVAEQFKIRHEEHRATTEALIDSILRTAGYSPATFGRGSDGAAMTAREVSAKQQRSMLTRDRKLRVLRPAISDILEKLLAVDVAIFKTSGVKPLRPTVDFPDGVQESVLELAQTAQALRTAEAASTEVLVALIHPEWDDVQVSEEVAKVLAEQGLGTLADPTDPNLVDGADPAGSLSPEELAVMVQKIYLGVGTVLSSEEARDILNSAGANLTGPAPLGGASPPPPA